jgi:hypothetical protein
MSLRKLNFDLLCEILKHFVAIDDEGPLTLVMVCTLWEDLVLSNPVYWTWITIDHKVLELNDRVQTFDALSAGHPLQLTIGPGYRSVSAFIRALDYALHR